MDQACCNNVTAVRSNYIMHVSGYAYAVQNCNFMLIFGCASDLTDCGTGAVYMCGMYNVD